MCKGFCLLHLQPTCTERLLWHRSDSRSALLAPAGGPPRFVSPLVPNRAAAPPRATLPYMLYLPGIDGTGLAAYKQFPGLVQDYDLRALFIPVADRTPFPELLELCECALSPDQDRAPPDIGPGRRLLRSLLGVSALGN